MRLNDQPSLITILFYVAGVAFPTSLIETVQIEGCVPATQRPMRTTTAKIIAELCVRRESTLMPSIAIFNKATVVVMVNGAAFEASIPIPDTA
ncbi:hypothetical protein BXP70_11035 [Hymenobacter crusticola]|uniref:Uncharacterized protein n=1 Tax=Hymenobacter crusticola TaxID=1770526 RepID=A0A243WF22_9BACT|nr:hypothetical protein BXP70_11035 [Hymenobacter crusticola]